MPAIDDDDNDEMVIEGSALMDSSDEDQIERKRRRQLAERWSNLEKDSVRSFSLQFYTKKTPLLVIIMLRNPCLFVQLTVACRESSSSLR